MQKARVLMITTDTTEPATEAATERPDRLLHGEARAAAIAGMRQLLNLLEAETELPIHEYTFDFLIQPHDAGVDADDNADAVCWLGTVAGSLGVDVLDSSGQLPSAESKVYSVERGFGANVHYKAMHVTPEFRAECAAQREGGVA